MSSSHGDSSPAPRPRNLAVPALGFAALVAGVGLIAWMAAIEARNAADAPWQDLLVSPDGEAPWPGTIAVSARQISKRNYPAQENLSEQLEEAYGEPSAEMISTFSLDLTERIYFVDLPVEDLSPILGSGVLPTPGEYEVLAGIHCRLNEFKLGNRTFKVTGRIRREVPGLHFAYLLPRETHMGRLFQADTGTTKGWLDIEGQKKMIELPPEERELGDTILISPLAPATSTVSWGVLIGLLLVAIGGATLQIRFFLAMAGRATGPLRPIFTAVANNLFLLLIVHIVLYGLFFMSMAAGIRFPVEQIRMQNYIMQAFAEDGQLSYITDAFLSGNILLSAGAIFLNNYGRVTVLTVLLPSCVFPPWGPFVVSIIFTITGFGMAPVWVGFAPMLTYHSITLTLELEAYVVAVFITCVLPIMVGRGIMKGRFFQGVGEAGFTLGSGALLTGIMLAIAALYEAATLITFQ